MQAHHITVNGTPLCRAPHTPHSFDMLRGCTCGHQDQASAERAITAIRENCARLGIAAPELASVPSPCPVRDDSEDYPGPSNAPATPTYHISARRWFDRVNGNTYHSVSIYHQGEQVARVPFTYGYGDCYLQTAQELLENFPALATIPPTTYSNGGTEPLRLWAERAGFLYSVDCADVSRKKDL